MHSINDAWLASLTKKTAFVANNRSLLLANVRRNEVSYANLFGGVSWCCGNYCLLAFVLWCGYCSVSFQSFVLRHWCPQHQESTLFIKEKTDWQRIYCELRTVDSCPQVIASDLSIIRCQSLENILSRKCEEDQKWGNWEKSSNGTAWKLLVTHL